MWKYNDELYHYGVLGMKWGVRRSREVKGVVKAHKKRVKNIKQVSTTKNERNARLAEEKREYANKLLNAKDTAANRLYPKQNPKTNARVNRISTGQAIAETLAYKSSFGALKFHDFKAKGMSDKEALGKAVMESYKDYLTMGIYGNVDYFKNRAARK